MPVPKEILKLVERFDTNREAFLSGAYNEAQVRVDFIDPFFAALGWDMRNERGQLELYREVVHEDSLRIGGSVEAPDLCFRIRGVRKFFVECKKPSVNLKEGINPAYQLRRYAWSAKLPFSILTDFEEFIVYDCRTKPKENDSPKIARHLYLTYKDYAEKWDEIASYFSREAVLGGSLDKYAQKMKGKRGTEEVDDDFLVQIERWREFLAKNIASLNPKLTVRELNFAVQQTIDRIIFLRICEDREIESFGSLRALLNGHNIYKRLMELFYKADHRYNSGLFHFSTERGRDEPADELSPALKIDDKPVKEVIEKLYYPSPYAFSVIPADILGQVYERFLGKVISLTKDHNAKIEEKPEVRKAGGVYYTPTYIVDYIVKNTVGKLLEGKTPKQAEKLKILDPACGSGSFLIGAFQYLIDWHRNWYFKDGPQKHQKVMYQSKENEWLLTTAEKKRILVNNIFGVDIDTQAVEVTKLSLLLKVLENENEQTLEKQLKLLHERALPDLGHNIKWGNSLIGSDFYTYNQMNLFSEEEKYRINVFDWDKAFPDIMKEGGFDAVIGNPPYGAAISNHEASYIRKKYQTSTKDLDSYSIFMEQSVSLSRQNGKISMIVPTGWYSGTKFSALRRFITSSTDPECFINLPYDIFHAWVDTTVFVLTKRTEVADWPRSLSHRVCLKTFPKRHSIASPGEFDQGLKFVEFAEWFAGGGDEYLTYADSKSNAVIQRVQDIGKPLSDFADVQRGVTPFVLSNVATHSSSRPAFDGTVRRYLFERGKKCFVRFDSTLKEPKPERYFKGTRLLLRELISRQFRLQAVKVTEEFVTNKSMQSILKGAGQHDLNYLLGVINSRLMSWYFLHRSNIAQRDDFPKIVLKETRSLPIRPINFSDAEDRNRHERIIELVDQMLQLEKKLVLAKRDHEKTSIERQIAATDQQIDKLVYSLYGLTEEEIKIVEGT